MTTLVSDLDPSGRYLNADRPHGGPSCGPHSNILKRVRHLRTAGQGHIANDALAMIFFVPVLDDHIARSYFYNEFCYSHGSVTLLGTPHAIFHACWVLVLFILIIVYIKS